MKRYYPFTTTDTSVAVNVYRSSQSVPVHRHTFWEIFLVTRGSCTHASEAGVAVFVPGDVCIIPPETEHLSEHIDFAVLAKRMYLSEKYFRQLFKEMTGLSPVEYVHRHRVVRSLIYLQKGCSVSEAGELVGWEDPNYYARVFKRVMGCPPKYFKQIEN